MRFGRRRATFMVSRSEVGERVGRAGGQVGGRGWQACRVARRRQALSVTRYAAANSITGSQRIGKLTEFAI